ncbi:hypothetical protein MRB53_040828 [Persea americana]|nr:hypothetical protein MRB53_040828 [Persea americana]
MLVYLLKIPYNDITAKLPRRYKPNTSQATPSQPSSQPVSTIAPTPAAAPAATPVHSAPNTNAPPAYPASSQVEAMYAYTGTSHDDLSFKQGDRITVTEYINSDWWRGQLNGVPRKRGLRKSSTNRYSGIRNYHPNEYNPQQYTSVQYAVPPPQQGQQGQPARTGGCGEE